MSRFNNVVSRIYCKKDNMLVKFSHLCALTRSFFLLLLASARPTAFKAKSGTAFLEAFSLGKRPRSQNFPAFLKIGKEGKRGERRGRSHFFQKTHRLYWSISTGYFDLSHFTREPFYGAQSYNHFTVAHENLVQPEGEPIFNKILLQFFVL